MSARVWIFLKRGLLGKILALVPRVSFLISKHFLSKQRTVSRGCMGNLARQVALRPASAGSVIRCVYVVKPPSSVWLPFSARFCYMRSIVSVPCPWYSEPSGKHWGEWPPSTHGTSGCSGKQWGLNCSRFPEWLWPVLVLATSRRMSLHTIECFSLRQERSHPNAYPILEGEGARD